MSNFMNQFRAEVSRIVRELQKYDCPRVCFVLEADGTVTDENLVIKAKIGKYGANIQGSDINELVQEYIRREAYEQKQSVLLLRDDRTTDLNELTDDNDIPF